jgi:hypothetical protein
VLWHLLTPSAIVDCRYEDKVPRKHMESPPRQLGRGGSSFYGDCNDRRSDSRLPVNLSRGYRITPEPSGPTWPHP